jgi:hypothetical protein
MSQQFGPDQPSGPVSASRHRLAQGQHATASPMPQHGAGPVQHLPRGAPPAADAATLHLTAAHPSAAYCQDAHGRAPSLTVQEVQASAAATELGRPAHFRSHPRGAAGIGQRPEFGAAPINGGMPVTQRPGGPAAIEYDTALLAGLGGGGGQLQGHAPDVQPPGYEHSTRAPGDSGYSRFGAGRPS